MVEMEEIKTNKEQQRAFQRGCQAETKQQRDGYRAYLLDPDSTAAVVEVVDVDSGRRSS
jgi:hypothetical protein